METIIILQIAGIVFCLLVALYITSERKERRGYLKRRPDRDQVLAAGRAALSQAKKILADHHRASTIGTAEAIVAQARKRNTNRGDTK
jgi:Mg2+/citrate symporter